MLETKNKTVTKSDFVAALRSGQYNQLCDGRMYDGEGRVCAMMVWHKLNGDDNLETPIGNDGAFGLSTEVYNKIAHLNDSDVTFKHLADYIEMYVSDSLRTLYRE